MIKQLPVFFILFLIVFCGSVSASTITGSPGSLASPGSVGSVQLSLDSVDKGLSGYILSVYPEDPGIVTISGTTFPSWATLSEVSPGSGAAFTIKALDLNESISAGAKDIPLATLNLNGIASGTTRIMVESRQIDDDQGDAIAVQVVPGSVTVGGSSGGQVVDLDLKSGWNLIGIPMTLQSGTNTAEIFKDVQSEGHSVFTYNGVDGWKTVGRTEVLNAMSVHTGFTRLSR